VVVLAVFAATFGPAMCMDAEGPSTIVPEEDFAAAHVKGKVAVPDEKECNLDVKRCFAAVRQVGHPTWKKPVSEFSGSYKLMCTSEIRHKLDEKTEKKAAEAKHKALCKKEEQDQKYTEKKLKLTMKKEKYSKAAGEGKVKYIEKKLKHAKEVTVKTAGKGKEFAEKLSEKSNKREDVLYKKECASKETAFKAVRNAKQEMKVVYVARVPTPAPVPKKKPAKVEMPKVKKVKKVKVVSKPKPKPKPKPVVKPAVVVKKTVKVVKPVVKKMTSLKAVLLKTAEKSEKAQIKGHELMQKANDNGKLAVAQEALMKAKELKEKHRKAKKDDAKEVKCKEKDGKEDKNKSESKTKLKIDRMKLEAARKEAKNKIIAPPKPKPCNPVTALEKYVKKCKQKEELFAKAKIAHEAEIKEIKTKDKIHEENRVCKLVHESCKQIFHVSALREDRIVKLVAEHTKELESAMAKTEKFEHDEASKMKFKICESAAKDMKYFVNKLLYTVPAGATPGLAAAHIPVGA